MDVSLVLAGDRELRSALKAPIEDKGLSESVSIIGWVTERQVRDQLLASPGLVLPSFAEGLAVVLMEAMVLQRPVITTCVAGVPELVDDDGNGWLVPAGDVNAIADALEACLATPVEALESMGHACRARAEACKLLEAFSELCG